MRTDRFVYALVAAGIVAVTIAFMLCCSWVYIHRRRGLMDQMEGYDDTTTTTAGGDLSTIAIASTSISKALQGMYNMALVQQEATNALNKKMYGGDPPPA